MRGEPQTVQLEYASAGALVTASHRLVYKRHFALAILSGCCVWICFLSLANPRIFAVPHLLIFASTIYLAIMSEAALCAAIGSSDSPAAQRQLKDLMVLAALGIFGVAPFLWPQNNSWSQRPFSLLMLLVGTCFAVLAVGSLRHAATYERIAYLCRNAELHHLAKKLCDLGAFKSIYESLWLATCSFMAIGIGFGGIFSSGGFTSFGAFFAILALFGAVGFLGVWIWMIVLHAILYRLPSAE